MAAFSTSAGTQNTRQEARECGFDPIDLVAVNLYPFEATVAKRGATLAKQLKISTSAARR